MYQFYKRFLEYEGSTFPHFKDEPSASSLLPPGIQVFATQTDVSGSEDQTPTSTAKASTFRMDTLTATFWLLPLSGNCSIFKK